MGATVALLLLNMGRPAAARPVLTGSREGGPLPAAGHMRRGVPGGPSGLGSTVLPLPSAVWRGLAQALGVLGGPQGRRVEETQGSLVYGPKCVSLTRHS